MLAGTVLRLVTDRNGVMRVVRSTRLPQSGVGEHGAWTPPKSAGDARDSRNKREDNELQQPMKTKNLLVRLGASSLWPRLPPSPRTRPTACPPFPRCRLAPSQAESSML